MTIAVPQSNPKLLFPGPESIVIVGEQPDVARRAIEQNVNCLIVCQAELPEELRQQQTNTCIIATPFDAYKAARMVYYAIEVARVCRTEDLEAFHLTDYLDDVREIVLKSHHRSYPILDENDKVVGTLSRYHLITPSRKRVVLVDDSIVRGTTCASIGRLLRDAGAAEVNLRIVSPEVRWPCFYGIDTDTREQLIAANMTLEEMNDWIGSDSLAFISLDGLRASLADAGHDGFCTACFTGDYPVPIPDDVAKKSFLTRKDFEAVYAGEVS